MLKLALTFSCFEPAILRLMTALQQQPHLPVATEALLLDLWFAWQGMTPEMWKQFLGAQGLIGGYAEQSRAMLTQMQEQLQKQTEQMLGAFGIKR